MLFSVTKLFPEDWQITVEVVNGGYDKYGEPLPDNGPITVEHCLIDYNQTVDMADRSEVPEDHPVLLAPFDAPIKSNSIIHVPETPVSVKSIYVVDGEVGKGPFGLNINLRKG